MHHRKVFILAQICPESNSVLLDFLDFFTISVEYVTITILVYIYDNHTHNSRNNNSILIYESATLTVQCPITKVAQNSI